MTLSAFTGSQLIRAKRLLAGQVANMMGRKLEEGDWTSVYCRAKQIPEEGWSNLNIDVNHRGLGIEMKLLRKSALQNGTLRSLCGQALMHPSATRSIRIDDVRRPAQTVMEDVFQQYSALIEQRTATVRTRAPNDVAVDMRTGWLIWESKLTEFLYFEERMVAPDADDYFARWHDTPAQGARKASRSLWIYDKENQRKRYSVTTSAGIKIQPYFDVPHPDDPNLYYLRVQSEPIDANTVLLWVAARTAQELERRLGQLDVGTVSAAVLQNLDCNVVRDAAEDDADEALAVSIPISAEAYERLTEMLDGVSDEHRVQLLLKNLPNIA